MLISVIVATCNRSENLRTLLKSLKKLGAAQGSEWETVIVDNNSKDCTKSLAESFARDDPAHFRYIFEGRQGKSYALNTAVREAKGDVLVFTDDDCIPDPHWLFTIVDEFTADSSVSAIGGRVELYDRNHKPCTILTSKERAIIVSASQILISPQIIGCNMSIRKNVFDAIGGFDPLLGPGTKKRIVSEDTDFLYRVFKSGFKMVYTPDVLVYHNHARTSDAEVDALTSGYHVGRGALYCKHVLRGDIMALKVAYWDVRSCFRDMVRGCISLKSVSRETNYLWCLCTGAIYMIENYFLNRVPSQKRHCN